MKPADSMKPAMQADSGGWVQRGLERLRDRPVVRNLASFGGTIDAIRALESELVDSRDDDLNERATRLRSVARSGADPDSILVEGFALVREAARRTLGLRPFDVQVLAGLVLHNGDLAEMQTGEGKTLAAVAPAWLGALGGRGVHVLTFNDYLARRDAEWMGPIYAMLGSSVIGVALLLAIDVSAPRALHQVWIVTGVWIALRAALGWVRVWPGFGRAPLRARG